MAKEVEARLLFCCFLLEFFREGCFLLVLSELLLSFFSCYKNNSLLIEGWESSLVVEYFPGVHKALGIMPSTGGKSDWVRSGVNFCLSSVLGNHHKVSGAS